MFVTIINDCNDQNAMGRQATRAVQIFGCPIITIGVKNDLEAAGNLIDALDAAEGKKGVILVNVAPRHNQAKKWINGAPFGYFFYRKTLVVSSIDGLTLSLVKKLKLVSHINLLDIPKVLAKVKKENDISNALVEQITGTQFRSFEFLPRVAKWIIDGIEIPFQEYNLKEIIDIPKTIWWVDNFGNCKTTILLGDVTFNSGQFIKTKVGKLKCFNRLKDLPNKEMGIIIGSSGIKNKRFLEIVIQGESIAMKFNLSSGYKVI